MNNLEQKSFVKLMSKKCISELTNMQMTELVERSLTRRKDMSVFRVGGEGTRGTKLSEEGCSRGTSIGNKAVNREDKRSRR